MKTKTKTLSSADIEALVTAIDEAIADRLTLLKTKNERARFLVKIEELVVNLQHNLEKKR